MAFTAIEAVFARYVWMDSYPDEQVKKLHLDQREYKSYKIYPGSLTAVA